MRASRAWSAHDQTSTQTSLAASLSARSNGARAKRALPSSAPSATRRSFHAPLSPSKRAKSVTSYTVAAAGTTAHSATRGASASLHDEESDAVGGTVALAP